MADIVLTDITSADKVDNNGLLSNSGGTALGAFDHLLNSAILLLNDQYNKGRITGTDYATVVLGTIQSAHSQAIQYVLGEQAADKQAEEIAASTIRQDLLANKQVDKINKDIEVSEQSRLQSIAQTGAINASITREDLLASSKVSLDASQKSLVDTSKVKEEWSQRQIEAVIKRDKGYTTATSTSL